MKHICGDVNEVNDVHSFFAEETRKNPVRPKLVGIFCRIIL